MEKANKNVEWVLAVSHCIWILSTSCLKTFTNRLGVKEPTTHSEVGVKCKGLRGALSVPPPLQELSLTVGGTHIL